MHFPEVGEVWLAAALAAVLKFGGIAAKSRLRIFFRKSLHFIDGAPDERGR